MIYEELITVLIKVNDVHYSADYNTNNIAKINSSSFIVYPF